MRRRHAANAAFAKERALQQMLTQRQMELAQLAAYENEDARAREEERAQTSRSHHVEPPTAATAAGTARPSSAAPMANEPQHPQSHSPAGLQSAPRPASAHAGLPGYSADDHGDPSHAQPTTTPRTPASVLSASSMSHHHQSSVFATHTTPQQLHQHSIALSSSPNMSVVPISAANAASVQPPSRPTGTGTEEGRLSLPLHTLLDSATESSSSLRLSLLDREKQLQQALESDTATELEQRRIRREMRELEALRLRHAELERRRVREMEMEEEIRRAVLQRTLLRTSSNAAAESSTSTPQHLRKQTQPQSTAVSQSQYTSSSMTSSTSPILTPAHPMPSATVPSSHSSSNLALPSLPQIDDTSRVAAAAASTQSIDAELESLTSPGALPPNPSPPPHTDTGTHTNLALPRTPETPEARDRAETPLQQHIREATENAAAAAAQAQAQAQAEAEAKARAEAESQARAQAEAEAAVRAREEEEAERQRQQQQQRQRQRIAEEQRRIEQREEELRRQRQLQLQQQQQQREAEQRERDATAAAHAQAAAAAREAAAKAQTADVSEVEAKPAAARPRRRVTDRAKRISAALSLLDDDLLDDEDDEKASRNASATSTAPSRSAAPVSPPSTSTAPLGGLFGGGLGLGFIGKGARRRPGTATSTSSSRPSTATTAPRMNTSLPTRRQTAHDDDDDDDDDDEDESELRMPAAPAVRAPSALTSSSLLLNQRPELASATATLAKAPLPEEDEFDF